MSLLLILALIIVVFAIFGGLALSPLIWLLIIVAVILVVLDRRGSSL